MSDIRIRVVCYHNGTISIFRGDRLLGAVLLPSEAGSDWVPAPSGATEAVWSFEQVDDAIAFIGNRLFM